MYYKGEGIFQDYPQAGHWFRKAAKQDYPPAQSGLGQIYYEGKGVEQHFEEAIYWTRKAAELGLADAQNNLGMMYYKGEGVPKDLSVAYQWVALAEAQGNQDAIEGRNFLVKELSVDELAKGERLMREWALKHPNSVISY